jgi:hypothetical protein
VFAVQAMKHTSTVVSRIGGDLGTIIPVRSNSRSHLIFMNNPSAVALFRGDFDACEIYFPFVHGTPAIPVVRVRWRALLGSVQLHSVPKGDP